MSVKSSIFFVLAVLVFGASVSVPASVVTVRPDGPILPNEDYYDKEWTGNTRGFEQPCTNGWSINTFNLGWGQLCPWGPSTYQNTDIPQNQCPEAPFPGGGSGAYYATCDYFQATSSADLNPSTAWLGTDKWNDQPVVGKRLGDITEMNYYSFTSKTPQRWGGLKGGGEVEYWTKNGWWNSWQQPAVLEFTAEAFNTLTNEWERRQFWYRPDGGNFVGDDGLKMKGYWVKWNCLTWGKWYSPQYDSSERGFEFGIYPAAPQSSWAVMMDKSVDQALIDAGEPHDMASTVPFKDWVLSPAWDDPVNHGYPVYSIWKSPGWKGSSSLTPPGHPNATGTGKPINFRAGARHQKPMYMYVNGRITEPTGVSTTLTANVAAGGGTVTCASTSAFTSSGTARIDTDDFKYTSKVATALKGCTEIDYAHLSGAEVLQTVTKGANTMWPNESYGFRGQVDLFTLGFNGTSVTYDFEPVADATPVRVVATNTNSLGVQTPENYLNLAPIIQGAYLFNPVSGEPSVHTVPPAREPPYDPVYYAEMAQKMFLCKVSGKVTRSHQGNWDNSFRQWTNSYFTIEDGTGFVYMDTGVTPAQVLPAPLWVYVAPRVDGLSIWNDDYVSVYGYVEPLRWKTVGTPLIMWSIPAHVTNYTFP